jgi:hypothetical protein
VQAQKLMAAVIVAAFLARDKCKNFLSIGYRFKCLQGSFQIAWFTPPERILSEERLLNYFVFSNSAPALYLRINCCSDYSAKGSIKAVKYKLSLDIGLFKSSFYSGQSLTEFPDKIWIGTLLQLQYCQIFGVRRERNNSD